MRVAQIWIDGRGYQGEHLDEVAGPGDGTHGHVSHANQMNKLVFGDEAYEIAGEVNLMSHLDRIMRQLRRGYIDASRIEIELRDEPYSYETKRSLVHGWEPQS